MSGFGGVLRGLTTAASGAEQGLANRDELERQARLQILAQRLQEATINKDNALAEKARQPVPPKYHQHINPDGSVDYLPDTPDVPQVPGQPPKPVHVPHAVQPKPVTPPRPIKGTDRQGNTLLIDPNTGVSRPVTGAATPMTPGERKASGGYAAALSADQDLTAIENSPVSSDVLAEVARNLTAPAIAKLVFSRADEALAAFRNAGMSDAAQTYIKRLFDYASLVGPARYGRRFNGVLLQQIWQDFGAGQVGIGQAGIRATQRNRANANRQLQLEAGPAAEGIQPMPSDTASLAPQGPLNSRFLPKGVKPNGG